MPPPSAIHGGGSVQQGLSAAYESIAFCKHRRAADKRYSLAVTMRVAEKTIELNFCAQFAGLFRSLIIWFGLTQEQEAKLGFDACTKAGGRLFIFQFKASNTILKSGARRFVASHQQMTTLQAQCQAKRSVFYVFPGVGTTMELMTNPDLLVSSWLLDVDGLPKPMPAPTKKDGTLRKSGAHYVDVQPNVATIHSEPREAKLVPPRTLAETQLENEPGVLPELGRNFEQFWEGRRLFTRNSAAMVLLPK